MSKYLIFTQPDCEYCNKAKNRIKEEGHECEEMRVIDVRDFKARGYTSVPQIFKYVGGYTELKNSFGSSEDDV